MHQKIIYFIACVAVAIGGGLLFWFLSHGEANHEEADETNDVVSEVQVVKLAEGKLNSVDFEIQEVQSTTIQSQRIVLGRMDYAQDKHVAIQAATQGILVEMLVKPGDVVSAGQKVAVLSSPEVGEARSEVRSQSAAVELSRTSHERSKRVCDAVKKLISMIRQGLPAGEIEKTLAEEGLGTYRDQLIGAYVRRDLAKQLAESSRDAAASGALPGRVQQEREGELQAAEAALQALMDESMFEVDQQCKASEAKYEEQQRLLSIRLQKLNALLGPAAKAVTADELESDSEQALSSVELVSPIDGTVEERLLAPAERVVAGDPIYVVADTSMLWAIADIRQGSWQAISVQEGAQVEIEALAIPGHTFQGTVAIIGRRVDPQTGAAPLIASVDVDDPRLRPGLLVQMTIPIGDPREAFVVPEAAVLTHDYQQFVFVKTGSNTFKRADVTIGEVTSEGIEILSGLEVGQEVVGKGAFVLKSELLLAGEEE